MRARLRSGGAAVALMLLSACGFEERSSWDWGLPDNYPRPAVPEDNPMSEVKVELGRRLFYDPALSGNQTQACASCHEPALAFTDGLALPLGSTGELHPRNSMSLTNAAYLSRLTWANPVLASLEQQALVPLFGEHPVELGLAGREGELVERLRRDPGYPGLFEEAFPEASEAISVGNVVRALGAFQRTLISHRSPYDRYVYEGDDTALGESELRGAELFFSERLECFHCHGGFNFSDSVQHDGSADRQAVFHNTGLYNVDGRGGYPADNIGLMEFTGDRRDMGRFRAPTLRNVELTAPYFHDGSAATLNEVLDHYAAGGRTIDEGPNAGIGAENPLKSIFVPGFELTEGERANVLAFLRSLTDREFVSDHRFASPFE